MELFFLPGEPIPVKRKTLMRPEDLTRNMYFPYLIRRYFTFPTNNRVSVELAVLLIPGEPVPWKVEALVLRSLPNEPN
jgi:hypothetical protein